MRAKDAFKDGITAIDTLTEAFIAEQQVQAAASVYRPQLRLVRRIEKNIRDLTLELKLTDQEINRLDNTKESKVLKKQLQEKRIIISNSLDTVKESFPKDWDEVYSNFSSLVNAENKARLMYRKQADNSYNSIKDIVDIIHGYDQLLQLKAEIEKLREQIVILSPEAAANELKLTASKFGRISGANKIKSLLTKSRKALKKKNMNKEKVLDYYNKAISEYEMQLAWRLVAGNLVLPELQVYLNEISDTLGSRLQEKLPRSVALYITSCTSRHRDLSLNF